MRHLVRLSFGLVSNIRSTKRKQSSRKIRGLSAVLGCCFSRSRISFSFTEKESGNNAVTEM